MKHKKRKLTYEGYIDISKSKSWYAKRKPEHLKDHKAQRLYAKLYEASDQATKEKIRSEIQEHFLSLK